MNIKKLEIRAVPFNLKNNTAQIYEVVIYTDKASLSIPIDLEVISLDYMFKKIDEFAKIHLDNYKVSKANGENNE